MRAFWKGAKRKRGRRRPLTMGIGHLKEKIYRCKRFRMQIKQFFKLEITLYLFHPNEDQLLYLVHFMSQMDRFEDSSEIRRSHKEAKLLNKLSPASKWEKKTDVGFPATKNWVVVSNIIYFHPYLGKISILTNIFQRGWNHQPENLGLLGFLRCFVGEGLVIEYVWKCPWQGDCSGASPKRGIVGGESPRKWTPWYIGSTSPPCFTVHKESMHFLMKGPILSFTNSTGIRGGGYIQVIPSSDLYHGRYCPYCSYQKLDTEN